MSQYITDDPEEFSEDPVPDLRRAKTPREYHQIASEVTRLLTSYNRDRRVIGRLNAATVYELSKLRLDVERLTEQNKTLSRALQAVSSETLQTAAQLCRQSGNSTTKKASSGRDPGNGRLMQGAARPIQRAPKKKCALNSRKSLPAIVRRRNRPHLHGPIPKIYERTGQKNFIGGSNEKIPSNSYSAVWVYCGGGVSPETLRAGNNLSFSGRDAPR